MTMEAIGFSEGDFVADNDLSKVIQGLYNTHAQPSTASDARPGPSTVAHSQQQLRLVQLEEDNHRILAENEQLRLELEHIKEQHRRKQACRDDGTRDDSGKGKGKAKDT